MRYRDFLLENLNLNSNFKNWFRGSKVVDKNNKPLTCYHGTHTQKDTYHGWTHFGTLQSAQDRLDYLDDTGNYGGENQLSSIKGANPNIHAVYLSIKNPVELDDSLWYNEDILKSLNKRGLAKNVKKDDVIEWMTDNYDGFYYTNTFEDEGSISWVPFDSYQIISIYDKRNYN